MTVDFEGKKFEVCADEYAKNVYSMTAVELKNTNDDWKINISVESH